MTDLHLHETCSSSETQDDPKEDARLTSDALDDLLEYYLLSERERLGVEFSNVILLIYDIEDDYFRKYILLFVISWNLYRCDYDIVVSGFTRDQCQRMNDKVHNFITNTGSCHLKLYEDIQKELKDEELVYLPIEDMELSGFAKDHSKSKIDDTEESMADMDPVGRNMFQHVQTEFKCDHTWDTCDNHIKASGLTEEQVQQINTRLQELNTTALIIDQQLSDTDF